MTKRIAAILCVAFLALTGTAAARTVIIDSAVSIKSEGLKFSGRVTSPNSACKDGRRVTLYRRLSGGGHQKLGGFTTGASGKWHVTVSGFAGVTLSRFYAKVKRRSEGAAGTTFVCRSARSLTIRVQ
jgi:hypothetical protein